jgi:hypothetical protein
MQTIETSAIILIDFKIANTIAPSPAAKAMVCDRPSNSHRQSDRVMELGEFGTVYLTGDRIANPLYERLSGVFVKIF